MISVFIPVYNGEKIVKKNVNKVCNYLNGIFGTFQLVVVDDGSTDKTSEILKEMKHVEYLRYDKPSRRENLGLAMKTATYDIVMFMDLDLAVSLDNIISFYNKINVYCDIVIGSKYLGSFKRSLLRMAISKTYRTILNIMFNSNITDYQCGFKMFKKDVLFKLLDEIGYDNKFNRGWFWDAQLLITAERLGYKINEVPIEWTAGEQSSFDLKREIKMIPYIMKLWRNQNI